MLGDCVDKVDPLDRVSKVIFVISVNRVPISLSHKFRSQVPAEGLVQQRLLQLLQRGELPLVEAREALGFGFEGVELLGDCDLRVHIWVANLKFF